jgi:hypothetical protein
VELQNPHLTPWHDHSLAGHFLIPGKPLCLASLGIFFSSLTLLYHRTLENLNWKDFLFWFKFSLFREGSDIFGII